MPRDLDWHSTVTEDGENIIFNVSVPKYETAKMTDVVIIPYDYGVVNNSSFAMTDIGDYGMVSFIQAKGDRDLSTLQDIPFIIKTGFDAFFINGENVASVSFFEETSLWWILLLAFLGGIVLNLMPCVFPVLSMKALSLVKLSDSERKQARLSGLAYTAGIILSFLLIAGLLIALKSGGAAIGWGFQLQNPWVIAFLIAIVIAVGLNLLGVFHISGGRLTSLGSRLTTGTGHGSSFWTGVLATAVATPCTAPFMATAVGFALTQNAVIALMVFAMLGAGLAFPYLLFCFIPAFQSILPKPGAWMETFRKILSIPMFLTALWLLWVLIQQLGLINHQITTDEPFTQKRLERVLLDNPGSPVFVDMTAAWCITCLVNKKTSIENERVQQAFEDNNVIYMVGDWTNKDAEIAAYLHQFGREGVPLYVYYETVDMDGVRPKPIVLPQILTPDIVIDTINGEI
jgi:thiol:disulfide interchange protein DsbD